jgi:Tol biopolymer transport system component
VFVRFEDETPVGYFVTNVDGTGVRQLTPDGVVLDGSHFGGSWSPSGDDILFVAREFEDHHKAIWIVNADGSNPVQVTDGTDDNPSWGPPIGGRTVS